jgi:hypothetical protein
MDVKTFLREFSLVVDFYRGPSTIGKLCLICQIGLLSWTVFQDQRGTIKTIPT